MSSKIVAKADGSGSNKLDSIAAEISKVEDKLQNYGSVVNEGLEPLVQELELLKLKLNDPNTSWSPSLKAELLQRINDARSHFSDVVKAHRDIHTAVSKFGKLIDKSFIEDLSHLATYFAGTNTRTTTNMSSTENSDTGLHSALYKNISPSYTTDDLFRLVVIEHVLRQGHYSVALELLEKYNYSRDSVGFDRFRELGELVAAVKSGNLEPARRWLANNAEHLGPQARHLDYVFTKLEFLATIQKCAHNLAVILEHSRSLVPFAKDYPSDFEHLMGSLVFLGRSLKGTPYEDLAFTTKQLDEFGANDSRDVPMETDSAITAGDTSPDVEMHTGGGDAGASSSLYNTAGGRAALARAANLFSTLFCRQLGLSEVDPLTTAFASGCRTLTRLHRLQRAIACLTKYSTFDGGTLPVAVPLDPAAHRHNIFHCPVIKEVVSANNSPVRLTCGHAISREAFNSLISSDGSKVKCPYCPMDTYRNQALDLIF